MARKLRIDFVSDVACPWCVIGLKSLDQALGALGDEVEADFHFQPFELNPDMPPEGQNTTEHVKQKYGSSPERSAAARDMIRRSGEAFGFQFNYGPDSRIWNTFDAHRLIHWADLQGRAKAMKEALFHANFTEQKSTSDWDALVDAAVGAGFDAAEAREVLESGAYTAEVRAEQSLWRNRGIQAVPSIIFDGRWMLQGAQDPKVFETAIRQILDGTARAAE